MSEDVLAWGGSINTQDTFIPRHHHMKFHINAPSKALFCALWLTILNYGLVVNIGAGMMRAWKDNPKPAEPEPKGCAIEVAGAADWRGDDAGGAC